MEKAEVLDSESLECILRECGENISDAVCGFRPVLLGINSKMGKTKQCNAYICKCNTI